VKIFISLVCIAVLIGITMLGCDITELFGTPKKDTPNKDQTIFNSPLVASWSFDSSENGKYIDSSGSGLDIYASGVSMGSGATTKTGSSLVISGQCDLHTQISSKNFAEQISKKGKLTISFWLSLETNSSGFLFYYDTSSFNVLVNNNRLTFSPSYPGKTTWKYSLPTKEWHYITITYDTQYADFYLDGILNQSTSLISAIGDGTINSRCLRIGYLTTDGQFLGSLDEVKIYDTILSASDIAELYSQY
jgi:hypothetical protein